MDKFDLTTDHTGIGMSGAAITRIIRQRRTTFADSFIKQEIPRELLEEILTNGTWAPTHKMTEPWRFVVLQGQQLPLFGQYMADYYKTTLPPEKFPPAQYQQTLHYPDNAACMIAILLHRSRTVQIPEWEELSAVAAAVQNMWLTCTAHQLGAYWDSCAACITYGNQLKTAEQEQCLGFLYIGYYDQQQLPPQKRRAPIEKKVTWLD
ncbi:nitroreductase family protein [Chitinophaga nivalis]|uniref:Nitroreductase n=1 Tax=Chitinophaga nivalis TaxID=2991709 RepID=A0ABT3IL80_9BACT|nr:nitroreductase [Chitinophaga nivalis]MCW3465769.1 nitroreductase [Chitinophaga nivalis]MCW3484540.1 nitroreductase [Chitinophaga nivalis]